MNNITLVFRQDLYLFIFSMLMFGMLSHIHNLFYFARHQDKDARIISLPLGALIILTFLAMLQMIIGRTL